MIENLLRKMYIKGAHMSKSHNIALKKILLYDITFRLEKNKYSYQKFLMILNLLSVVSKSGHNFLTFNLITDSCKVN